MFYGTASLAATNDTAIAVTRELVSTTIAVTGTWAGTLEFEGSMDEVNYFAIASYMQPFNQMVLTAVENGIYIVPCAGMRRIRVRASSLTSGTAVATWSSCSDSVLVPAQIVKKYSRQTGDGTTTVKSGRGVLHGFVFGNDNQNATYTFYDNTTATGTVIASYTTGSPSGGLLSTSGIRSGVVIEGLDLLFNTGLTVTRSGGSSTSLTVIYR